jgi:circadian clock protein KaiB
MSEPKKLKDSAPEFELELRSDAKWHFVLQLYVAGTTTQSTRAIHNVRQICTTLRQGRCELRVVDVYQSPGLAREAQIIALPTLVRTDPKPVRKLVGDLSDRERVLRFLHLDLISAEGAA